MANRELKLTIAGSGLTQYEVAEALGWSESGFSRRLRKELSTSEKEQILTIIEKLKQERSVNE